MIRTVVLHGAIKDDLGVETVRLDVNSPRELFAALRSQIKNFRKIFTKYPNMHLVLSNSDKSHVEAVDINTFNFPLTKKAEVIHLLPSIDGSGAETVAYLIMEMEMSYAAAVAVTVALDVAAAVCLSYVASTLAPSPDTSQGNPADKRPSFLFNGAINVIEQGYPVPLVYGIHTTGSVVVSVGVDVAELPYETTTAATVATSPPTTPYQWGDSSST